MCTARLMTVASRTFTEAQMNSNRMHAYDCIPLIVILETEPWPHFGKFYYLDSILFFRVSHSSFLTDEFRVQGPHRVEMEPVHKVSTCFQQPPIQARWNKPTSNCGLTWKKKCLYFTLALPSSALARHAGNTFPIFQATKTREQTPLPSFPFLLKRSFCFDIYVAQR